MLNTSDEEDMEGPSPNEVDLKHQKYVCRSEPLI